VADRAGARTEISGEVTPEVSAVRIDYRQAGAHRSTTAALGKINGVILKRLHIEQTGGIFAANLAGCVPAKSIHVTVVDKSGQVLATKSDSSRYAEPCKENLARSSGFHLIINP
jgi:hypothetical protein